MQSFVSWLNENKETLKDEFAEFKANCKLEHLPTGTFKEWSKKVYDEMIERWIS